jgi:hypothetical protein
MADSSKKTEQPRPLLINVEIIRVLNVVRIPDQQPFIAKELKPSLGL